MAKRLEEAGWGIKYIDHVENRNKRKLEDRPWFNTTFSKLHVFNLQEYDKVQIPKIILYGDFHTVHILGYFI